MSDVTTGTAFNPQFFMNPPWWLGRVEEKETWSDNIEGETFTSVADIQGWGHRYKVRVFNWHTGELDKLAPKDMAFCQVVMPVTAGSGHGGAATTPSIESGSVVFGFFMDGMAGQEGYIIGVLGNSNNNVPKKREIAPTNAPQTSLPAAAPPAAAPGVAPPPATRPVQTQPARPPVGPGSLSHIPLQQVPNVDQLSTPQLLKLLDPSKTPSSAVFKAASEARQKAKAQKLSAAEVERQVLIATVKASRQPAAAAGSEGNCNPGYQQFNDTYTDGNLMRSARVPDDRIVGSTPLSTTEAQHVLTLSKAEQEKDAKKRIPLSDVCSSNNSNVKGVQRVLKNVLGTVEELKKQYNQVSAFSTQVEEYSQLVQQNVTNAAAYASEFVKDIMEQVRSYVLVRLQEEVKEIAPFLFPSENVKLDQKVQDGMSLINCLFNRIADGLKGILGNLISGILDNAINAPLCAAEKLLAGVLDSVLGPIMSTLQTVFDGFNSALGVAKTALGAIGSIFDAVEFIVGIQKFFSCDDSPDCVEYSEISQDRSALPGGDVVPPPATPPAAVPPTTPPAAVPPEEIPLRTSPTGTGANASQPVSANVAALVKDQSISSYIDDSNVPNRRSNVTGDIIPNGAGRGEWEDGERRAIERRNQKNTIRESLDLF